MPSTGMYGGVPADERRAQRRRRLLAAGLELMGTQGWAATSVRGVCREAQLSTRFFYESFPDLDALAVSVFDDIVAATSARMVEAVAAAPDDPREQTRAGIATALDELTRDPRRTRVVFAEALGSEALTRRRLQAMRDLAALISAHGRATYRPPPEADALTELTATMLAGGFAELLITWLNGELAVSREQLVDDCSALFMATVEGAAALGRSRAGARA